MAAYTSYDTVGKREDISDVITMISPTKTPFTSLIKEGKVHNTIFQWQEDALASPNLTNAQVDGFVASDAAPVSTVMRNNVTQILAKTVNIAETTEAVSRYGRAKEIAYQLSKYAAEVKRDLEAIYLSGQTTVAGNNATARTMNSFQAQVDSSLLFKTGGAAITMAESTGTVNLMATLQALYVNGVDPDVLMVPPAESLAISNYAAASGRYRTLSDANSTQASTIVNVIDLYVSPFGEVKVILNRFQLATDYLIFDPAMWERPVLRPWSRETLAKVGDSTRMLIVGEFSLRHKNYFASAIVRKSA
jgi:hypothetical protein